MIITEDLVNHIIEDGGGSAPVDTYTKTEVDTLLAKKFELTGNNTISGENSFYAVQNFNTQVCLYGLMRVMDGGVLRATTGKILIDNAPTEDTQAANKKYVDDTVAAAGGGTSIDAYTKSESDMRYPQLDGYNNFSGENTFLGGVNFTSMGYMNMSSGSMITLDGATLNIISGSTLFAQSATINLSGSTLVSDTQIRLQSGADTTVLEPGSIQSTNGNFGLISLDTVTPTDDSHATSKYYVDNQIAAVESEVASNTTKTTTLRNDLDDLGDQVAVIQGTVNTLATKDRWILNGKPENLTLTTSLQKVVMPATTRFPTTQPASMEMTEDGTGILFKKAGLVHFRRRVSLGGSNTENLFYEMRVNDTQLEPLQAQSVSISKDTMSYTIDFYWQVTAQQTLSIWANCLENTCALNYKGVTTIIEYI